MKSTKRQNHVQHDHWESWGREDFRIGGTYLGIELLSHLGIHKSFSEVEKAVESMLASNEAALRERFGQTDPAALDALIRIGGQ